MFYVYFSQFKSLLKTIHLLVKKHKYQYLILASLILVVCYRNSVSHFSTIQLGLINEHHSDFESYFISVTISLEMPVPSQGHYSFHSFPVVD